MLLLILVLARLILCAIFGVAGVTKLLDRQGTREAVRNFGAPTTFVGPIGILLPVSELTVAVALFFSSTAWWGAFAALILLCVLVAAIGINLKRGRAPECHCFGQLYSRPLGWPTLLRSIAFALLAGFVLWQGPHRTGPGVFAFIAQISGDLSPLTRVALMVAMIAVGVVAVIYLRKARPKPKVRAETPPQGLPLDSVAPAFELAAYEGGTTSLAALLKAQRPLILMFSSPSCGPCAAIFREVAEWQRTHGEVITIAVVSQGTIKENFVNTVRNGLRNVLLQQEREVADIYHARVTPTAVVVQSGGRIGSAMAAGADEIRLLIQATVGKARMKAEG